jgi:hypothetical protein
MLLNPRLHYRFHMNPPLTPILCQMNPVYSTPSYFSKIHFNIVPHLRLGLSSCLLLSGFSSRNLQALCILLLLPHTCYMPYLSPLLVHSNSVWRRVQIMKFHIMQISPASYYFIPLLSKYSPQHPVLKQAYFLPLMTEITFHTYTKLQEKLSFCIRVF